MSVSRFPHAHVPFGTSQTGTSLDEALRPGLRRAYPLPDDKGRDERFQHLLRALADRERSDRPAGRNDDAQDGPTPFGP
ncbi:hypothetical protein ACFPOC_11750 [Rubellimicrobium aerolatum]|uniref:Anti-sigma factor NepR domain-containing protein n=1 Tax=Rubellimicrobium aerolatum TaxID=490979 RepID=A0ABW0SE25_9RHOB